MTRSGGWIVALALASACLSLPAQAAKSAKPAKSTKSTTKGKTTAAKDTSQVLVWIGNDPLTAADLQKRLQDIPEQFRAQYTTPEGKKTLLDRVIEEQVWYRSALHAGVDQRDELKQQIERTRKDLIVRTYVNEVMAANPTVDDAEIADYYQAHLDEYRLPPTVTVDHLQTKSEADGKRMKQQLARGQKWNDLVMRYSADTTTRKSGGRLGAITKEGFFPGLGQQPALAESAFALAVGQIGGPWKSTKGFHLIRVESAVKDSVRPLDSVRPVIQRQLTSKRQQDFYKAEYDSLRRNLNVRPDSNAINRYLSARKTPREMFDEAQKAGTPQARIAAYQKLLEEYPDSEVSPQAQFMTGFVYSEELKDYDKAEQSFKSLLARYPKSELAASAKWMIQHMRTEEAPGFMNLEADSSHGAASASGKPRGQSKP